MFETFRKVGKLSDLLHPKTEQVWSASGKWAARVDGNALFKNGLFAYSGSPLLSTTLLGSVESK